VPEPIATWNPARSVWETRETLICGHWDVFSETWPSSGMTRSGVFYPLPPLGHPTGESGFSSPHGLLPTPVVTPYGSNQSPSPGAAVRPGLEALLKTPTAQLAVNGGSQHPDKRRAGGHGPTLADQIEQELILLSTPMARDHLGKGAPNREGGTNLPDLVAGLLPTPVTKPDRPQGVANGSGASLLDSLTGALLPTPKASDGEKGGARPEGQQRGSDTAVSGDADPIDWGSWRPAVDRWARALGRAAPRPTELSPRGGQVLSPPFVEWMMGLPPGHVTGVPGLTRADQLKALGNGVVPQQAGAAVAYLLQFAPVWVRADLSLTTDRTEQG
jgi:hypothetical protein